MLNGVEQQQYENKFLIRHLAVNGSISLAFPCAVSGLFQQKGDDLGVLRFFDALDSSLFVFGLPGIMPDNNPLPYTDCCSF